MGNRWGVKERGLKLEMLSVAFNHPFLCELFGFSCWLWSDDFLVRNGNEVCLRADHSAPPRSLPSLQCHMSFPISIAFSTFPAAFHPAPRLIPNFPFFFSFPFSTTNISLFQLPSTLLILTIPRASFMISIRFKLKPTSTGEKSEIISPKLN